MFGERLFFGTKHALYSVALTTGKDERLHLSTTNDIEAFVADETGVYVAVNPGGAEPHGRVVRISA